MPLTTIALLVPLTSCSNSIENLSLINISDAKSLFIGSIKNSVKRNNTLQVNASDESSSRSLLKITDDGNIQEVTYADKKGKSVESTIYNCPQWIKEVNDDYIYISFDNNKINYLVNKTTNRAYQVPETFNFYDYYCGTKIYAGEIPQQECFPSVSSDSFYVSTEVSYMDYRIKKIDISNPDDIKSVDVSAANDNPSHSYSFAVDKNGNLAYSGSDANGGDVVRFVTPSGSIKNVAITSVYKDFWTGYDGYIYALTSNSDISKITLENNSIKLTKFGTTDFEGYSHADWFASGSAGSKRLYLNGLEKIINVKYNSGFTELYNNEGETKYLDFKDLSTPLLSVKQVASSDTCIYVSGQMENAEPIIAKIDVSDNYKMTILSSGKYDASSLSIDKLGNISFCGLDMFSGATVVGTISSEGEVNISSTQLNKEIDSFVEVAIN